MTISPLDITIISMVKNESWDIAEWAAFYFAIGVRKFLIIDNQSDDQTRDVLQSLPFDIDVIDWPYSGRQVDAYRYAISHLRRTERLSEWITFLDSDEYLAIEDVEKFHDLFQRKNVDQVALHWKNFASASIIEKPNSLNIEAFIMRPKLEFEFNQWVKSIVRVDGLIDPGVHMSMVKGDSINSCGESYSHSIRHNPPRHRIACVHHYSLKSRAHFEKKVSKGNSMHPGKVFHEGYWRARDLNEELDNTLIHMATNIEKILSQNKTAEINTLEIERFNKKAQIYTQSKTMTKFTERISEYIDQYTPHTLEAFQFYRAASVNNNIALSEKILGLYPKEDLKILSRLNYLWDTFQRPINSLDTDEANTLIKELEWAACEVPDATLVIRRLFAIYAELAQPEKAENLWCTLTTQGRDDPYFWFELSLVSRDYAWEARAMWCVEKAIEINPDIATFWSMRIQLAKATLDQEKYELFKSAAFDRFGYNFDS